MHQVPVQTNKLAPSTTPKWQLEANSKFVKERLSLGCTQNKKIKPASLLRLVEKKILKYAKGSPHERTSLRKQKKK